MTRQRFVRAGNFFADELNPAVIVSEVPRGRDGMARNAVEQARGASGDVCVYARL
jgi:hypothetical protein